MPDAPGPPFRDYLPPDAPPSRPAREAAPPRPGFGTVFVREVEQGRWWASWQDAIPATEPGGRATPAVANVEGGRDEVVEWARTRPAARRLLLSSADGRYVPLEDSAGG